MNTTRKSLPAVLGAMALGLPLIASAGEPGFYVGGQYGVSNNDVGREAINDVALAFYDQVLGLVPTSRDSRFESEDMTWGFFGGYRLFTNLAFEGGFMSLGKEVVRENVTGVFLGNGETESWSTSFGVDSSGFAISALGVLPITYNWEIYARGGVYFGSNTLSYYVTRDDGLGGADQIAKSSTDFLAGIGAGYTLADVYELRAEYQRVFDAGAKAYGEGDIDLITIGITVRF